MPTVGRGRPATRRSASALALALSTYALVLAAGPLLHHDLVCHLKSRTHCTSCVAGISAPGLASEGHTIATDRTAGGDVQARCDSRPASAPFGATPGRAPPA